ncbi:MAG: TolB family protein, partial [Bacteriovoracia bacterium]
MRLLLALGLVLSLEARAQLGLQQSSPELNWLAKENAHVKLIFSEELSSESDYLLNLVEHYSHLVGLTYGIREPQQFPLIMRPEVADPNGFVTLAPRRSEWFANATFLPFVGSSEWYQTLAIHEYRHIIQYDHFKQGAAKYLDYFLGDTGAQVAMFLGLQSWYFEGDAVWAETKYTDAGRGRSPRFLARLKALVLSERIPSYDEFLSGSYNNLYPNQYVWGYVLVSRATQKFGEDFWQKVTAHVARFPHPWRLVNSFKHVSGQSFTEFYFETMQDLRDQWKDDLTDQTISEYREETYPTQLNGALYLLKYDLDSYTQLTRRDASGDTLIADIPFFNEVTMLSMGGSLAVYPQFLPDKRYGYKGSSDLVTVDLTSGEKTQITDGERFYNPRLNAEGTKLLAVEFTKEQHWQVVELSPAGKRLRQVKLSDKKIVEATYLDDNRAWALVLDPTGARALVVLDLATQDTREVLRSTKNLLYNLSGSRTHVVFEAQYQGKNEIFRLSEAGELQQCTHSRIGAFAPSSDGTTLFYSAMDVNGSALASVALNQCQPIPQTALLDFNYLSKDSPSDNY